MGCFTIEDTLGHTATIESGTTLGQVYESWRTSIDSQFGWPIVLGALNNEVCDFHTEIRGDCHIRWIPLNTKEGYNAYQRTLILLMVRAAQALKHDSRLKVNHSLGKALYCEWLDSEGSPLQVEDVKDLELMMYRLQDTDPCIQKIKANRQLVMQNLRRQGRLDEANMLADLDQVTITFYGNGGTVDYFYGPMLPSMTYLTNYELQHYAPGFLARYPSLETPNTIEPYVEIPKFAKVFLEAKEWARMLGCPDVVSLNQHIKEGSIDEIIELAEALQEKKQGQIADYIVSQVPTVKMVLIAGPSSAGKTTFTKRLCTQLRINNRQPLMISLDDYFHEWPDCPRLPNGNYDFECLEALDLDLFQEQLTRLYAGKEVRLPVFNFQTGTRSFQEQAVRLQENSIIVVEGLHALNDDLSRVIPRYEKCKIYLGALTQLTINDHNRISTTDTRLIRRIVRDYHFRGHDARGTFRMWANVRKGEEEYIFPFQEDADVIFNSALIYELAVLKKEAMPLLNAVPQDDEFYPLAEHLKRFLSPFKELDRSHVPKRSILREFVGSD